ncbi:putative protein LONGIFOLIA 1/2 [Rosa chinensis]|uniref:DUF4378 domain-containing protein n=1 Tax=Rosa chinensis TaxID=74649 RepID=A0A2P6S3U5_ROSCH|nr:protein LONGIFOLIA 2 [Rosa chinensis]XP_024185014.1 protein LONGIFOLIA 2 [Rosa chinensis]XP_024185017.1 protein LONGIFOLIA 2 [Rosa chinensis]XP_040371124.1 protein LONGIFOLIA 2 [Rosa chinensis]PRQ53354.1 putative protein LONGIFOLIA 1/2 [Rosa chinensis]
MSAKVFHSFRDENRDLQKQLGCMSGIFQLFDRRHFLSGRSINGHSHKRLPPGENGKQEIDPKSRALPKATDKNRKKAVKERRNSTESSTTTVSSSSCSSSFSSSLEYNKAAQQEQSLSGQTIYNDRHTRDLSMNKPNISKPLSQQSFDSTYREARGISVRPGGKDGVGHRLKYIDSPRPSQPLKPIKPRVSGGESFQVHAKLREAHRNSNEEKDGCMRFAPKEARRLSYDERASRDTVKSTTKLKELPRLSLDSKERSIRRACSPETRSSHFFKDLQRENGNCDKMLDLQPEPGSSKRPNVVAKLMGLDLSDSVSTSVTPLRLISTCPSDRFDPLSKSLRKTDESKQDVLSGFPRNTQKSFSSPQRRSANSVMQPTANSKFPIETAPWRQPHGSKGLPQSTFNCQEEPTKAPKSSPSVYGEMEKRLAELEFKKSGKDLRALKQILEAMQKSKQNSEDKKEASNFASQVSNKSGLCESTISASKRNTKRSPSLPATAMGSKSPKSCKSPIIIMKPGKLMEKTHNSASTVISMDNRSCPRRLQTSNPGDNRKELLDRKAKDLTPRNIHTSDSFNGRLRSTDKNSNVRTSKAAQKPKMPHSEENSPGPSRSITSPRLQNRRFGLEKQSAPTTLSSDSSMTRRQHSRQSLEASTPGRKLGPKSPRFHQSNCQLSETSTSTRAMSHQDDTTSQQSESNTSLASHADTEATSIHQSDEIRDTYMKQHSQKQNRPAVGLSDDRLTAETGKASLEQPSPISVLDSTFYRDDSPSPVKKISNAFKDDGGQNLDEAEYGPMDLGLISNSTTPSLGAEIDHKRLENLKHLIHNHRHMSSTHEEPIFGHITFLCDRSNPDHMYISDILLASGILRYLESAWTTIELQTLEHLINPNLFLALEEIRADIEPWDDGKRCEKILQSQSDEKIQRKLVFDVVKEFLVQKLVVENSFKQWFSPNNLAEGKPRGQQLLTELCSQVDQLQRRNLNGNLDDEDESLTSILLENFMDQSQNWTVCDGEIPSVVLDVERLIFKDLITEIVSSDAVDHVGWSGGHCRQLFSKKGLW